MLIVVADDYEDLSKRAAQLVVQDLGLKDNPVAVFPTGNTPLGLYRELVAATRRGDADLRHCTFFSLDEYAGLAENDARSFMAWLRRKLLDPARVPAERLIAFDPRAADPDAECLRMEEAIRRRGGIDLVVLGLGPNGHLGFNEPGSAFDSRARLVALAPDSLKSNAAYWGGAAVPTHAYTLGLGTLAEARRTLLLVNGAHKADILARTLTGPITPEVPATVLRNFADVTVMADLDAVSALDESSL